MHSALLFLFAVDTLFLLLECAQPHSEDQRTLTLQLLVPLKVRVIRENSGYAGDAEGAGGLGGLPGLSWYCGQQQATSEHL